ncbi:hypothetical protein AC630_27710 [Bradyrhizobium sp. AS23.2]|nr:hypothetical protein AC630_27710 [Bradyrhizobium sp. AS23.2]
MIVNSLDREALRAQFRSAKPFPFVTIENFLEPSAAAAISAAYPSFEEALAKGVSFQAVNERKKVQITDAAKFPAPIAQLNDAIASAEFLSDLSYITGIPNLLADPQLVGGGMHMTGPGGRLDVHLDFNYMEDRQLHRRLNLLVYLNPEWKEDWGGQIQLWDKDVKNCDASFIPKFNRCVIFETSDISYHGVMPISAAAPGPRISFATYYYTKEAPAHWTGVAHSTIFKARPEEKFRGLVLMPAESIKRGVGSAIRQARRKIKSFVGG